MSDPSKRSDRLCGLSAISCLLGESLQHRVLGLSGRFAQEGEARVGVLEEGVRFVKLHELASVHDEDSVELLDKEKGDEISLC
jgi:hypothetical protein